MCKVYCYINKINNKKYIGITKRSLDAREINHVSEAYNIKSEKYNTPFKIAIRKYGINNFTRELLEEVETLEEANEREKLYKKDLTNTIVKEYNTLREIAKDNNLVEQTLGRHINKGEYLGYYWTKE